VLGPKKRHYVIDHHHLSLALHKDGLRDVLVTVVLDLSALEPDADIQIAASVVPDHLFSGLRSSCERAEFMLALVTAVAPVSTLAGTCSPLEAASAILTPS